MDLPELQTTDLKELVEYKVRQAYASVKAPVLVEDTSLYFSAWDQLPGPLIKWFVKHLGLEGLVRALSPFEDKSGRAVCCLGYTEDGETVHYFEGEIRGHIVSPRGTQGFGWDVIFQPEGQDRTFAEMTLVEKQAISMRRLAANRLNAFLVKKG